MNLKGIKPSLLKSLIAKSVHLLVIFSYLTLTLAPNYALATQITTETETRPRRQTLHLRPFPAPPEQSVPHYKIRLTPAENAGHFTLTIRKKVGPEVTDFAPEPVTPEKRAFLIEGLGNLEIQSNGLATLSREHLNTDLLSLSVRAPQGLTLNNFNFNRLKSRSLLTFDHYVTAQTTHLTGQDPEKLLLSIKQNATFKTKDLSLNHGKALILGTLSLQHSTLQGQDSSYWIAPSGSLAGSITAGRLNQVINHGSVMLPNSTLEVQGGNNKGTLVTRALDIAGQFTNYNQLQTQTLLGQGTLINHAAFKELQHLNIRQFHNLVQDGSSPTLASDAPTSTTLTIGPKVEHFVNGEDAQVTYSTLTLQQPLNPATSPVFHNQGDVLVKYALQAQGHTLLNDGTMTIRGLDLGEEAILRNSLTGTVILKDAINTLRVGSLINEGKVQSYGDLNADGLRHFAINQGSWIHQGGVSPDAGPTADDNTYTFNGHVKLTNGPFFSHNATERDTFTFINKGNLSLDLVMYGSNYPHPTLALENHHKLKILKDILMPIMLDNHGQLSFADGIDCPYQFKRFNNPGRIELLKSRNTDPTWAFFQQGHTVVLTPKGLSQEHHTRLQTDTIANSQLEPLFNNTGTIEVPSNLAFAVPTALGRFIIPGNLDCNFTVNGYKRSLHDLKDVYCDGTTTINLQEQELQGTLDLTGLYSLRANTTLLLKVRGNLSVQELFLEGEQGFDLGQDNDHFGSIYACRGRLSLRTQGPLNAKYGYLYSNGPMDLAAPHNTVTLGDLRLKPGFLEGDTQEGWVTSVGGIKVLHKCLQEHGAGARAEHYDVNGALLYSNDRLHVLGRAIEGQGVQTFSQAYTTLEAIEHITAIRSIFEGQSDLILKSPRTSLKTKGIGIFPTIRDVLLWVTCDTFLSQGTSVNFNKDIHFIGNKVEITGSKILAGQKILYNSQEYAPGISSLEVKDENTWERFYSHKVPSGTLLLQTLKSIMRSGESIILNVGQGALASLNLNTRKLNFNFKSLYATNNSTVRNNAAQVNIEISLNDYFAERAHAGIGPYRQLEDGRFSSVIPLTSSRIDRPLPTLSGFIPENIFDPLAGFNLRLTLQELMSQYAGQVHYQGRSGGALYDHILMNSVQLAEEAEQEGQVISIEDRIRNSTDIVLIRVLKEMQRGNEVISCLDTKLLIPGQAVNPFQSPGDMSAEEVEINTEEDATFKSIRLVGDQDVDVSCSGGSVTSTREVHRVGSLQWPGPESHFISLQGEINLLAAENVRTQGSRNTAKKKITHIGGNHVIVDTVAVENSWDDGEHSHYDLTHYTSHLESGEGIDLVGHNMAVLQAAGLETDGDINVKGRQGVAMPAACNIVHDETHSKKKGHFGGSKRHDEVRDSRTHLTTHMNAKGKINIKSEKDNIIAEAPVLKAGQGISFSSPAGKLILKAVRDTYFHSVQKSSSNMAWQSVVNEGESRSTVRQGVYDPGEGEITVDAPEVNVEKRADQLHDLNDALFKALKNHNNVTWQGLEDTYESWHEEHHSLSPALGVVIGIAVGMLTAGTGAGAAVATLAKVGETAAAFISGAVNAGISSLASQASISMFNNQGDIGAVLKDLSSKKSLQSLVTTMATAGLTKVACLKLDINLGSADNPQSFVDRAKENLVRAGVNIPLESVLNGQDFGQTLESNLRAGIANILAGHAAAKIGVAYHSSDASGPQLDEVSHKLFHALVGAGMAAITKGDILAGSVGAVIGEIVAAQYRESLGDEYDPSKEDFETLKERGVQLARLSAAFAAFLTGRDPNDAAMTAGNAARENSLATLARYAPEALEVTALTGVALYSVYLIHQATQSGEFQEAVDYLVEKGKIFVRRCQDGIEYHVGNHVYTSQEAAIQGYLDQSPLLQNALEKFGQGINWCSETWNSFAAEAERYSPFNTRPTEQQPIESLPVSEKEADEIDAFAFEQEWSRNAAYPIQDTPIPGVYNPQVDKGKEKLTDEDYDTPWENEAGALGTSAPGQEQSSPFSFSTAERLRAFGLEPPTHTMTQAEIQGPILESFPIHKDEQPLGWITPIPEPRGPEILSTPMPEIMGPTILGTPIADPLPPLPGFDQADPESLRDGWIFRSEKARPSQSETILPYPIKPSEAVNRWNDFLGAGEHTNIHPRTGEIDVDRIVSEDAQRSIRYGNHEMNSTQGKHHYHEETWTLDPTTNKMNVENKVVRVPLRKG